MPTARVPESREDRTADRTPTSLESAFAKLTGRQASEEQRERFYRLRDALGLRDNDAFWSIVMALEYYDSFLRQYPAQFAEASASAIENARAAFAAAAQREAAQVQRILAAKVAETSVNIARGLADRPIGVHHVSLWLGAAVAFGALCVHAGYRLASVDATIAPPHASDLRGMPRALASVLSIPAGWMIFACLLAAATQGIRTGWAVARDPSADRRDRVLAGCLVALCVGGSVACAALIASFA
jgi:hypothetical protein